MVVVVVVTTVVCVAGAKENCPNKFSDGESWICRLLGRAELSSAGHFLRTATDGEAEPADIEAKEVCRVFSARKDSGGGLIDRRGGSIVV